jgi:ABC-type uncharacterized transport system substrate-binding protein
VKRRTFITLLGGAATAWSLGAARGQQRALPMIGLLSSRSPAVDASLIALIRQGLNETGFVEGQNIVVDYRWAEGQYDRLAGLAADLAQQQVALIVTLGGDPSALAAKARAATVPIVFATGSDPVRTGLAANSNESYRLLGVYAARILKGENHGDLPIQRSTKFELVINVSTARALGMEIPPTLLARADEVIE